MRVAAVVVVFALVGCAKHHLVDPSDGGPRDTGTDAPGRDAPALDAPVADAPGIDGGACRDTTLELACTPGFGGTLPVGVPTSLRVGVNDCHCDGRLTCSAEVLRAPSGSFPGAIEVDVQVCDELDCRACTGPTRVDCMLPALAEGDYQVLYDRAPLFQFQAGPPGMGDVARCQSPSSVGGGLCDFPGQPWIERHAVETVCFPDPIGPGSAITVASEVSCAFEPGPCEARLGADGITLTPRLRNCDEGSPTWGCTGRSGRLERFCPIEDAVMGPVDIRIGTRVVGRAMGTDGPSGLVRCVDL